LLISPTRLGSGGIGRHAQEIADAFDFDIATDVVTPATIKLGYGSAMMNAVTHRRPLRSFRGACQFLSQDLFDRAAASEGLRGEQLIAFQGSAEHCFIRARRESIKELRLIAPTAHIREVERQHAVAYQMHPIERDWLSGATIAKVLREYELADVIEVSSQYARRSFLNWGVPEEKIFTRTLTASSRFVPPEQRPGDNVFRVIYVGSLTTTKGIPILLEAFERLRVNNKKLILVGGWATRGMRRYLQNWQCRNPGRLRIEPGDPLPHLHDASVYVHPSWQDGWGYAPHEALMTGLPVIVTEDTGMKELIEERRNGRVVSTGEVDALAEAMSSESRMAERTQSSTSTVVAA